MSLLASPRQGHSNATPPPRQAFLRCERFEVQLLRLREPRVPDFVADLEVPHIEGSVWDPCDDFEQRGTKLFAQYQSLAD